MARTAEQLTPEEVLMVQELEALGNSGAGEAVRKVAGHFVNGAVSGVSFNPQVPVGTVNGVNTHFTVTLPLNILFLNGIFQTPGGVDYTLTGSAIDYVVAPTGSHYVL